MLNDMDVEAEEEAPATRGAAYWRERVDAMLAASKEASPVNAAFVLGREYGNASLEDAGHIVDELERLHGIPRSPQDVRGADVGEARAAAEEAWKHFNDRVRDRVEGEYGAFTNADWQAAVALRTALRSPEPAETGITQVRILAKALLDGRGREAFTPAEWSALWALAGGSPEPAAEPEEHPKPETVTEPRNPHDSKRLGGKSTDPVSVLVEEALDEIMDELSDYSKTLTTCGRIRVHLTVLQNASSLSRQPSLPPDER
jgi:hypothetical protein